MEKAETKIVPEIIVDVVAYATPPKDKDGNLIKGEDGKTVKGEILGKGSTYAYTLNQAGFEAAVKRYTLKAILENLNRQLKTDKRNALAAEGKAPEKGIRTKCKVMVDMIKGNDKLKAVFITEVGTWEHLEVDTRKAIIAVLQGV